MQRNPILGYECSSVAVMKRKRKRETTTDHVQNGHFSLLPDGELLIAVQIGQYLDPPSRQSLMKVNDDFSKQLSRFYCAAHGSTLSAQGYCLADVQDQMERDGHDFRSFHEKLARRMDKVDPADWYARTVPCEYEGIMPLDFDPVYQKYLSMMKECEQCEIEATDAAMAGIGLQRCMTCHDYCCYCQETVCDYCDNVYCSNCYDFEYCRNCEDGGCVDCMELRYCVVCNLQMCAHCYGNQDFKRCDNCGDDLCWRHQISCDICHSTLCQGCRYNSFLCDHQTPRTTSDDDDDDNRGGDDDDDDNSSTL